MPNYLEYQKSISKELQMCIRDRFVTPEEDASQNKIENAVYDLYRQLGVVTLLDPERDQPDLAHTPCVGMHLCTQVPVSYTHLDVYNRQASQNPLQPHE